MNGNPGRLSSEMKCYLKRVKTGLESILKDEIIGIYVHGSLALGGFNPTRSDIDLIVVVPKSLSACSKKELARYFLDISKQPYPMEISVLSAQQLKPWQFPTPYEFHFSEYWRDRYGQELAEHTELYLNSEARTDPDLAAHVTIMRHCGICLSGKRIELVFPEVPKEDYLASLLGDFEECLQRIQEDPVYCILNMIRVYWYLKEEKIASKKEAGLEGNRLFPEIYRPLISQAIHVYENAEANGTFNEKNLNEFKRYLKQQIEELLEAKARLSN